ncbi:uncharacterized protein MELLADRAFT_96262 [Melampsora larici-populina 98AG31]|uniref:Uncharacterized protein n=1 Tax=Melampsora larici-populina (strain 98AG31 / pathotype 3-4-7) TaxID=747676 RepID=F4RE49_MELLP|nr:uncharacterized protein MELLADRAFT_96262 [Melampsora larici-populina 98AG31]EGG09333.1 hypothetical protein MELLADRAFT_96262 [Melampsora larici-populina 98AG31]
MINPITIKKNKLQSWAQLLSHNKTQTKTCSNTTSYSQPFKPNQTYCRSESNQALKTSQLIK